MDLKLVIRKLIKKHQLNFNETQTLVFINHLETFYDRLQTKTDVGLVLDDNLRKQLSTAI
jgi:hypothetical protein